MLDVPKHEEGRPFSYASTTTTTTTMTDFEKPPVESESERAYVTSETQENTLNNNKEAKQDVADNVSEKTGAQSSDEDHLDRELSRIDTSDYPKAFALAMIVIALALSMFLCALDMTIVATAIPRITDEFHSLDQVGWYGSAFFLTLGAFQSTWGKVFKYFPLKLSFLISILIFELGSLICGVAQSSTTLIVGRAVAGAGGAGIASGVYTIIAFSAPPNQRAAYTGIMGAVFGVASVIGPLLGGVFTDNLTWRWCFYINLPVGGVAAVFIFIFFKAPKAARPTRATLREKILQLDLPGSFILMAAIVCYLLAMQWGGTTKPWSDGSVVATLVLFGVLVISFIAVEYFSGDRALLQGRLLKDRTIAAMCAFIFVVAGSFFILLYYLPYYFQATRNISAASSGIRNLPLVLGCSIFSIISGILISVTGLYVPFMMAGGVVTSIGCGLIYTLQIDSSAGEWIGYQAIVGVGVGFIFQIPVIVSQSVVKISDISSVSAMILFFQTVGGAIWISAAQSAFVNTLVSSASANVPGISSALVVSTGATELRKVFTPEQIPGILDAYMDGLQVTFIIAIACACGGTLLSVAPRWENIKGKTPTAAAA